MIYRQFSLGLLNLQSLHKHSAVIEKNQNAYCSGLLLKNKSHYLALHEMTCVITNYFFRIPNHNHVGVVSVNRAKILAGVLSKVH